MSIQCFAEGDPDEDGNLNLSNVVVTYNHLSARDYTPPPSNSSQFQVITAGTIIGRFNSGASGDINHLHLEVLVRGQENQAPTRYGFFDNVGSIVINPLFMFKRSLAEQTLAVINVESPSHPYYPLYNSSTIAGNPIRNLDIELGYGIRDGDLDATSAQGAISLTGQTFWQAQTPTPVGVVEWPTNRVSFLDPQSYYGKSIFSMIGSDPVSLISYLTNYYPDGTNYYVGSENQNCTPLPTPDVVECS